MGWPELLLSIIALLLFSHLLMAGLVAVLVIERWSQNRENAARQRVHQFSSARDRETIAGLEELWEQN
jgi:hypothetical protein